MIRTRELQCFCLKKDYRNANLGVGISVDERGRVGTISSEFDLLSQEGFYTHHIRRSTQGITFGYWLPLPIANGHWRRVRARALTCIDEIGVATRMDNIRRFKVIFKFMNDIVVKLNQEAEAINPIRQYDYSPDKTESTLTHASEKAIESYFHLFHLLICLATEDQTIVQSANSAIRGFESGNTSKNDCPDLGHLLLAALISDLDVGTMMKDIIKETMTRNVVWMLGKNPGLAFLEADKVSDYRLQKTFEASKTSYRLLMFLNLFRKTALGSPRKSLAILRDEVSSNFDCLIT